MLGSSCNCDKIRLHFSASFLYNSIDNIFA
nr:MAG TPA: hypothetical protein [Caudoviricetes sp.]